MQPGTVKNAPLPAIIHGKSPQNAPGMPDRADCPPPPSSPDDKRASARRRCAAQPRLRTTRRDSGGGKFFPARYFPGPGAHADTQARAARAVRLHLWCKPCAGWSGMPTGTRSFRPFWRVRCPTQNKRRSLFRTSPLIQSKTVPGHRIRTRLAQKSADGPTESRRPSARPRASAHRP